MTQERSLYLKNAQKLLAAGKIQPAIEEYLKVLKDYPADWTLMMQVGDLYLKAANSTTAIRYFEKVADHYAAEGFYLKAIAVYKRMTRLDVGLVETRIKLADLYFKQGLITEAKFELLAAVDHYEKRGNRRETIRLFLKLMEFEPDDLEVRTELARTYEREGLRNEAVTQYMEISGQLARKGRSGESLAALENAKRLNPRNAAVLWKLLWAFLEQNETEKTNDILQQFSLVNPSDPEILSLIVKTFSHNGQVDKMMEFIDRSLNSAAKQEMLRILKGELYLKQNDVNAAFAQFCIAIEEQMARKEFNKGISLMKRLTRVDSTFHAAWELLIDLYRRQGQEGALPAACAALADAYISKGMYQEAIQCLKGLLEREPGNRAYREKLDFVRSMLQLPQEENATGRAVDDDFEIEIDMNEPRQGEGQKEIRLVRGEEDLGPQLSAVKVSGM